MKNPKDDVGMTPLHYAAKSGHTDTCKIILEHVNENNPKNSIGKTPLEYAKMNGHLEVVELISNFKSQKILTAMANGELGAFLESKFVTPAYFSFKN